MNDLMVEIRTDEPITTADTANLTPEDARSLHDWAGVEVGEDPVRVVVMDSGIHEDVVANHPWFDGVDVVERYDATGTGTGGDAVGHGTGVASIYAKNAPKVELIDVRIFGNKGRASWSTIRDAYEWLIDNADEFDIVNMSWGSSENVPNINALHDRLLDKGVQDVVAAGNTGSDGGSPATARTAFSAGAVDANGDLTRFSSSDPNRDNPDVSAAGQNVKMARAPGTSMGTPLDEDFVKASGTSFAAPYTGAAYVLGFHVAQTDWDTVFEKVAPDIPGTEGDGDGLLKLAPALKKRGVEDNPEADVSNWSFVGNDVVYIDADWIPDGVSTAVRTEDSDDSVTVRFEK